MSTTRIGPVTIQDARAYYDVNGNPSYYAGTGWIAVVTVAGEIRVVLTLESLTDPTGNYRATLAFQVATNDPNDPEDWQDYATTNIDYITAVGQKQLYRLVSPTHSGRFWIRVGVSVSLSSGSAGDTGTADIGFLMAAAGA